MASPDKTPPVFVDGIGPPLSQIVEDYEGERTTAARDVLALVAEVVRLQERLQQERDDYLRVVQAARLALDFLPATGQVSLPHRRGLEVVRAELRNALAALVASPDKPPDHAATHHVHTHTTQANEHEVAKQKQEGKRHPHPAPTPPKGTP